MKYLAKSRVSLVCCLLVGLIACFGPLLFDGVSNIRVSMILGGIFALFCAVVLVMSYLPRWKSPVDERSHKTESVPR